MLNKLHKFFQGKKKSLESFCLSTEWHTESELQAQGGLLLDVVVGEGADIRQLFAGKDQSLLVWGNAFLFLNLSLDIFDGVRSLHFQSNGLAGPGLNKDPQGAKTER